MKWVFHIARIILAITFIFSGFVKGIDPWGSAYKFTDYLTAFHWSPLVQFAFPLGVLLAFGEFAIGVGLLFNLFMRLTAWLTLLFMAFFTCLTLYSALANPVSDCGCFGDAIVLSNWATFYKNLVFSALAIIVFLNRRKFVIKGRITLPLSLGLTTALTYIVLVVYSYNHLPLIDFLPYKVGANIPEGMKTPGNAPKDVYETIFRYENTKTGKIKKFVEENHPWQDSLNWKFVSMDTPKLIKAGYKPPIHDFVMESEAGDDVKEFFLYDEGYTFILVARNLTKTNRESFVRINELADYARSNNMKFVAMTSTGRDEINQFKTENKVTFDFFNCDEITLKTMIRPNPGLLLLKKGTVIAKWHYNDIPNGEEIKIQLND